jgi:hypothetical protein
VDKFITGESADIEKAGFYLEKIWRWTMVRRTYASPDPSNSDKRISDSLPNLYNRRVLVKLTKEEKEVYERLSREPKGRTAVDFIINVDWLCLYQTTADTLIKWKSQDNLLYQWVKLAWDGEKRALGKASFEKPQPNDAQGILTGTCHGSPKIR